MHGTKPARLPRILAPLALSGLLAGCAGAPDGQSLISMSDDPAQTGSISTAPPKLQAGAAAARDYWAGVFGKNPGDEKAAIAYARALKTEGAKDKAFSVLQQAAMYNSQSKAIASEEGRLALDLGQAALAEKLLTRANDPASPDWRILNALGAIEAQRGNKTAAKAYFEQAMRLAPNDPGVLNNMALAYALDGDPARAEGLLRKAAATGGDVTKIRQNLAIVLGVQGKSDEAQQFAATDLAKEQAAANRAYLEQMVASTPIALGKPAKPSGPKLASSAAPTAASKAPVIAPEAWATSVSAEPAPAPVKPLQASIDWLPKPVAASN
jgi:Flp pilus assembly protein TadD